MEALVYTFLLVATLTLGIIFFAIFILFREPQPPKVKCLTGEKKNRGISLHFKK